MSFLVSSLWCHKFSQTNKLEWHKNSPLCACKDRETLSNAQVRPQTSDGKGLECRMIFVCERVAFNVHMLPVAMSPLREPVRQNFADVWLSFCSLLGYGTMFTGYLLLTLQTGWLPHPSVQSTKNLLWNVDNKSPINSVIYQKTITFKLFHGTISLNIW